MRAIKLPFKYARALLADLEALRIPQAGITSDALAGIVELRKALAVKPAVKARRAEKAEKRATRKDDTERVREAVCTRADGLCESCRDPLTEADPGELDHFFGRGKVQQRPENCWLLHRGCHRKKTNNEPSAAWWLEQFIQHCDRYGFTAEAWNANARLQALKFVTDARNLVADSVALKTWKQQADNQGGE